MIWHTVIVVVAVYVGISLAMFVFQSHLVFFPDSTLVATPRAAGLEYEDVRLRAEDGTDLHGWFVPGAPDGPVVLFFHGNAGNISHRLETLRLLRGLGASTLIIDYRGYGLSEGRPSEDGLYQDARAAWVHLTTERGIPPSRIIVFGRSLGGAVAVWLAAQVEPAGVVAESTFTSAPDLGASVYPWLPVRLLSRFSFDSAATLPTVACPVLVVHSRDDEIVPFSHGERLYQLAPEPREMLELRGGHNDGFLVTGPRYTAAVKDFLWRNTRAGAERPLPVPSEDDRAVRAME